MGELRPYSPDECASGLGIGLMSAFSANRSLDLTLLCGESDVNSWTDFPDSRDRSKTQPVSLIGQSCPGTKLRDNTDLTVYARDCVPQSLFQRIDVCLFRGTDA